MDLFKKYLAVWHGCKIVLKMWASTNLKPSSTDSRKGGSTTLQSDPKRKKINAVFPYRQPQDQEPERLPFRVTSTSNVTKEGWRETCFPNNEKQVPNQTRRLPNWSNRSTPMKKFSFYNLVSLHKIPAGRGASHLQTLWGSL